MRKKQLLGIIYRLSAAILFVLIGIWIILTVAGYKINLQSKGRKIIPTALLVVKSNPSDTAVYFNGQRTANETPYKIGALSAGWYELKIEKKGYYPWQKTIHLIEGEARVIDVILFLIEPQQKEKLTAMPEERTLIDRLTGFAGNESDKLQVQNGAEIYDGEQFLTRFSYTISQPRWYQGENCISYIAPDGLYVAQSDGANNARVLSAENIKSYTFIDGGKTVVYQTGEDIWSAKIR